jgi:hypothetical protein
MWAQPCVGAAAVGAAAHEWVRKTELSSVQLQVSHVDGR